MRWCVQSARFAVAASLCILSAALVAGCQYGVASPTTPTAPTGTGSSPDVTALTYTADIRPVLASDCVRCHGPSRRDAGIDLSTYANVLTTLTPGSASSRLILATRSGGIMYGQFSGSSSTRAA
jgi:hypothetical protein